MQSECATLQEQLNQAQKMEAVGQLAAGVAHDFNNLITLILAHAGQARAQTGQTPEVAAALEVVENAARQATEVTRALMTFSSGIPARKERMDLRDVLQDSVRMLARTLPASIEMAADCCEQPQWVLADPTQLHQVVLNLALNARDAMPTGGRLTLRVEPASTDDLRTLPDGLDACADWVRLLVRDTGVGIPRDLVPRVFEPFFTTKPRGQGTGLGLPVVHGIIREHRGHIRILSEPGTGTEFCVLLPAHVAPEPKAPQPTPVTPACVDGALVLLAEDNTPLRRVMTSVLQNQGFRVIQAVDGEAVLAAFGQHGSDLRALILDLDLPRLSGWSCLRRIRCAGCRTPAILITATPDTQWNARQDPDTQLLRKPFRMEELAAAACAALRSNRRSETEVLA
jgi:nitrogen-specific signal transduction histidine kinase/ActR/RegA family two-component response regulator